MFPENRQTKLNPVLEALKALPGHKAVWQDDFDSTCIVVHITLDDDDSRGGSFGGNKPFRFKVPIRQMKARINKVFASLGIGFSFTKCPKVEYIWNGRKVKDGYDGDMISMDVYV